jgi:hypothetical protein
MGDNTIATVSNGEVASEEKWNQYKTALVGDILPRNTSGAVTNEAADIGSSSYRFEEGHFKDVHADTLTLSRAGYALSASSGTQTITSHSLVDVTNLTVTMTTNGRPLEIVLVPDGSGSAPVIGYYTIYKDSVAFMSTSASFDQMAIIDFPTAASHTYKIMASAFYVDPPGAWYNNQFSYVKLLIIER